MREQVYLATKEAHEKVENQFGFAQGLKESAYYHFLLTMYRARKNYQPSFDALERLSGMSTFNSSLLQALEDDLAPVLKGMDWSTNGTNMDFTAPQEDLSRLTGIHYVFAGSSAGAAVLLKMIKVSKMELPKAYIQKLTRVSGELMAEIDVAMNEDSLNKSTLINGALEAFEWFYQFSLNAEIQRNT
jgi:heme oxygenase